MQRHRIVAMFIGGMLVLGGTGTSLPLRAAEVVELRVRGRYLNAPATVRMMVLVEPDATNRLLRVEADGDRMFRATSIPLDGAAEKRLHEISFRDLPAGFYTLRAAVLSSEEVRGMASERIEVVASPGR